jgi:acyl carrier protein
VDPSQVSADTNLVEDLGFDSLDAAELLAALHQETGLQLDVCSIKDVKTVNDLVQGLVSEPGRQEVGQQR